jgi:hypothetical protein
MQAMPGYYRLNYRLNYCINLSIVCIGTAASPMANNDSLNSPKGAASDYFMRIFERDHWWFMIEGH